MRNALLALMSVFLLSSCFVSSSIVFSDADIHNNVNLIRNGGFSSHTLQREEGLSGWSVITLPETTEFNKVKIDAKKSYEGDTSLCIDASPHTVMIISEPFPVRRYGGYYGRMMLSSNSTNPPMAKLRLITFRDNGKITNRFTSKVKYKNEWNRMGVSGGFLRPKVKFGRLIAIIPPFSDGSVWLDDAGCWEVHGFLID